MMRWLAELPVRIWRAMLAAGPIRLWAMIGAAPPLTAFAVWLVWIVWKGPWLPDRAGQQLNILGWALWGLLTLIGVVVIALAAVKVKASAPGGAAFEVDGDDRPDPPTS